MSAGNLKHDDLMHIASMPTEGFVALDIEATGDDPQKDQVVAVAVVDAEGDALFDRLIKPTDRACWPAARQIRGMQWSDVECEQGLLAHADELGRLLEGAPLVVCYDAKWTLAMLEGGGLSLKPQGVFDFKREYAKAHGRWSDRARDYTFAQLDECARRYGYAGELVTALSDAKALAYAYQAFVGECRDAFQGRGGKVARGSVRRGDDAASGRPRLGSIVPVALIVLGIAAIIAYFLLR
jgi:DNA polymerase III epsilon subunit-like protein